jgi:hypothetical protein
VPRISPQAVLLANAVFAALAGALLVLAPASGFFENLGLPVAEPEIYAQFAGGLLLLAAVLLWEAPSDPVLERHVGRTAAAANVIGAAVLVLWLVSGELDTTRRGDAILWTVTAVVALFAVLEARYLRPPPR